MFYIIYVYAYLLIYANVSSVNQKSVLYVTFMSCCLLDCFVPSSVSVVKGEGSLWGGFAVMGRELRGDTMGNKKCT